MATTIFKKYIQVLHSSYGNCCRPNGQEAWERMNLDLNAWAYSIDEISDNPNLPEVDVFIYNSARRGSRKIQTPTMG